MDNTFILNGYKLFLIILSFFLNSCSNAPTQEKEERLSMASCNFDGIKSGDIVLKRGKGPVSKMITDYFKEKVPISHCGVIICAPDSIFVVHSVAGSYARKDGVQTILLKDMLNDCRPNYFYIVRKKTSNEERENFASKALSFSTQNIAFDNEADNKDKTKMSCTELIYWSQMESYGESDLTTIKAGDREIYVFNALLDTAKYEIIKHY